MHSVWVRGDIPVPPTPPWVREHLVSASNAHAWWPGLLLSWRWVDEPAGQWTALVRYTRDGLAYEHWVPGTHVRDAMTTTPGATPPAPPPDHAPDR